MYVGRSSAKANGCVPLPPFTGIEQQKREKYGPDKRAVHEYGEVAGRAQPTGELVSHIFFRAAHRPQAKQLDTAGWARITSISGTRGVLPPRRVFQTVILPNCWVDSKRRPLLRHDQSCPESLDEPEYATLASPEPDPRHTDAQGLWSQVGDC